MTKLLTPIILSGGSGTRLWPLSRKQRPKQFLPVIDDETLFQSTVSRLQTFENLDIPLVVCNEEHRFLVAEQLRQLPCSNQGIILEPLARNTAPALALAALECIKKDPDAMLLVLPADHIIRDLSVFHLAIQTGQEFAEKNHLVTFGIVPTTPETGYGYIQFLKECNSDNEKITDNRFTSKRGYLVKRFVEKPSVEIAKDYCQSGEYLWNSGMFLFRADVYLNSLKKHQLSVFRACEKAMGSTSRDGDFIRIDENAFAASPNISIDYAVMENTKKAAVIPLDAGWSDVGAWSAVWEVGDKDIHGNVKRGDSRFHGSTNNLVYSEKPLVSLLGVDNLVVIDTKDATLVAHRDKVQDVKIIVEQLKLEKRPEAILHREVFRPWGSYESIDSGQRFQVKRITVKPGATLSLQKHHHRAEHWTIVSGTAEVTCNEKVFLLTENQSTYIPLGATHRLTNPGKVLLELIEVQSGSYLGEDDIVRYEDEYGRTAQKNIYEV